MNAFQEDGLSSLRLLAQKGNGGGKRRRRPPFVLLAARWNRMERAEKQHFFTPPPLTPLSVSPSFLPLSFTSSSFLPSLPPPCLHK